MSTEQTPPAAPPPGPPDMAAVLAASNAATQAAQEAKSAAEASTAAIEAIKASGLNLPQGVIDSIGGAASGAWEQRMRELGALVEDDGSGTPAAGAIPDPTGGAAAAASAAVADAAAAVAGAVESPDDIIFPTMAHKILKSGVRRADWGK